MQRGRSIFFVRRLRDNLPSHQNGQCPSGVHQSFTPLRRIARRDVGSVTTLRSSLHRYGSGRSGLRFEQHL
ncbi:unnamed protein product [Nesidiocoris tenuis]|uniref:Uncharacterized protein n=1 Tax=Nesidiocoris tenuis TaxID=355587 RepID=A0A6H5G431_9HEMI|nr:unnamed protein product [Nesidiocoris tenuis]